MMPCARREKSMPIEIDSFGPLILFGVVRSLIIMFAIEGLDSECARRMESTLGKGLLNGVGVADYIIHRPKCK